MCYVRDNVQRASHYRQPFRFIQDLSALCRGPASPGHSEPAVKISLILCLEMAAAATVIYSLELVNDTEITERQIRI